MGCEVVCSEPLSLPEKLWAVKWCVISGSVVGKNFEQLDRPLSSVIIKYSTVHTDLTQWNIP